MSSDILGGETTRGILNPTEGLRRFELTRRAPDAELAHLVDWIWIIRYKLDEPYEQEVLPHPCVNLSFERTGSAVHGIGTKRHLSRLVGEGRVVAAKFKPGGFFGFTRLVMRDLRDRIVPVLEAFGEAGREAEARVLGAEDDARAAGELEAFLLRNKPNRDAESMRVLDLARRAETSREVREAEDLAKLAGVSVRTLHRLFERYVGVGPKWIIQRSRVQEAAERVREGNALDWSALAQELGYHDQAHLIRDFKAQIGFTPDAYRERCSASAR